MRHRVLVQLFIALCVCTYAYTDICTSFTHAKFEVWHGQETQEVDYPSVISVSDIQQESAQEDFNFMYLAPIVVAVVLVAGYGFERSRGYRRPVRVFVSILLILAFTNVMFFAPQSFTGYDIQYAEAAVAIQTRNTSKDTVDTLSHSVSLPASIASGDLIIVQLASSENTGVTYSSTGYTSIGTAGSLGANVSDHWFYRYADGSEGASVTFTSSGNSRAVHRTWRITGHDSGTAPEHAGAQNGGGGNAPDPPSLSPSWGAEDSLWLVGAAVHGRRDVTAAPTNYTDLFDDTSGTSGDAATDVTLGAAERFLNASSDNPGTFTSDAPSGRHWAASTVAIRPAAALSSATSEIIRGGTVIRGGTIFR